MNHPRRAPEAPGGAKRYVCGRLVTCATQCTAPAADNKLCIDPGMATEPVVPWGTAGEGQPSLFAHRAAMHWLDDSMNAPVSRPSP